MRPCRPAPRAGVLEGIALVGNPDFALVDEAFPYLAKRLMTDDSPRLRAALRYMVYGEEGGRGVRGSGFLKKLFEGLRIPL